MLALYSWTTVEGDGGGDNGHLRVDGILLVNAGLSVQRYQYGDGTASEGHLTLGPTGQLTGTGWLQFEAMDGEPASLATGIDVSGLTSSEYNQWNYLSGPISAVSSCAFADVSDETAYYFKPVYWAARNGVTTGKSPTSFDPKGNCTREQTVAFLWRLMGSQTTSVTASEKFTDVKPGAYYETAVGWAYENGITTGTSATSFGVGKPCTREQCVAFLWRAAGCPEATTRASEVFRDVKAGAWYDEAIGWALEKGITTGTSPTTFGVGGTCSRAMIVTFLQRTDAQN